MCGMWRRFTQVCSPSTAAAVALFHYKAAVFNVLNWLCKFVHCQVPVIGIFQESLLKPFFSLA
jgi:hypothetical protein